MKGKGQDMQDKRKGQDMQDKEHGTRGCPVSHGFDPLDSSVPSEEVWRAYDEMRGKCPVAHDDKYGGYDVILRYEDVRKAAADPRTFSSAQGTKLTRFRDLPSMPYTAALEFDEPEHSWWRALIWEQVSPKAVKAATPMIRDLTNQFIDRFAADGATDLFSALAEPLPVHVIARIVGLDPEPANELRSIAINLIAARGTDELPNRWQEFTEFLSRELEARRQSPRDDYLTRLASGDVNGTKVTEEHIEQLMLAFLVGGHHSTASGLAALFHDTLAVPDLRDRLLAEPDLIPRAVEESLRLQTPLQMFARRTKNETIVGGVDIPVDYAVLLNYASANRDESVFDDPDEYDVDRRPNRHLAFGYGQHACVGSYLARAEMRIGLTELLRRLPDIQLAGEVRRSGLIGENLMTIESLPVRFTAEASRR